MNTPDQESPPISDEVKIGIELEGVGTLGLRWAGRQHAPRFQGDDRQAFMASLKRSRVIRSSSFGDTSGMALSPEEVGGVPGATHPAELISSPHALDAAGLTRLHGSFRKARYSSNTPMLSRSAATLPQRTTTVSLPGDATADVTATWARGQSPPVRAGALQTTLGVRAATLCNDDAGRRQRAVLFLSDPSKAPRLTGLLDAAVSGERALTADQVQLPEAGTDAPYRLRLVLLMYLLHLLGPRFEGGFVKDAFGCNIKGFSSLVGCGLGDADDALVQAVERSARALGGDDDAAAVAARRAQIATRLRDAIVASLAQSSVLSAHSDYVASHLALENIGQPGLSAQVAHEGAPAIPCFLRGGQLYTLVEARARSAPLNAAMAAFLNATPASPTPLLGAISQSLR